jgi:DNA mismatch repair protein MutL
LDTPYIYKDKKATPPSVDFNKSFNPFDVVTDSTKDIEVNLESSLERESLFENVLGDFNNSISFSAFQLNNNYIITKNSSGIVIINQKRAHQRILYEKFLKEFSLEKNSSQALIFPKKLDLNTEEIRLLRSIKKSLIHLGFNFNKFNSKEIEVSAIHPIFLEDQISEIFRELIDNEISDYKKSSDSLNDYMAKILSKCSSIKSGIKLKNKEQESLVNDLFACKDPNISPFNKLIFKVISIESINKMFFK